MIVDPFGHRWMLLRRPAQATRLRQGDVASVTITAPDTQRAAEFYQAVLQVPFSQGHPGMWRTGETTPPVGILPSRDTEPQVQLSYRVDDIAAAAVRAPRRLRRRPGRGVPALAAGRPAGALAPRLNVRQ